MGGGPDTPKQSKHGGKFHDPESMTMNPEHDSKSKKEYRVLVTGMGPFPDGQGGHYDEDDNTSHLVTKYLPSSLPVGHPSNPTTLPITILNPTSGPGKHVKTEYAYIRRFIQDLYDEHGGSLDAIIHLGMADGWEWFSVEERAFGEELTSTWWGEAERSRGYYLIPDDAGKTVRDITEEEGKGMWKGMPLGIAPDVNVERLVNFARRTVNSEASELEGKQRVAITPHFEAGNYGCGFIYYESLATCLKRRLQTKVVFCHIPGWRDGERLERGADVVCGVIGGLCQQIHRPS